MTHLCLDCPKKSTCTEICELLEKELPSVYAGQERTAAGKCSEVEAIIKLYEDGKTMDEIAYHVPYSTRHIRNIIKSSKTGVK